MPRSSLWILLPTAAALVFCLALPARAETSSISEFLDQEQLPFHAEGLQPVSDFGIPRLPGQTAYYYARLIAVADVLDGGPNISGLDPRSPAYQSAFATGFGLQAEMWVRFIPNIYLTVTVGASSFSGGTTVDMPTGERISLGDMTMGTATIGGAFAAPLHFLMPGTKTLTDEEGLLGTVKFDLGAVYQPAVSYTVEESVANPVREGESYDYWDTRVGFTTSICIGLEYRVGTFSILLDIGFRSLGKPKSATEPRNIGAGETIFTYPLRFGVCYRF